MQYTSNYNLMLPEGTDTVNLLTQMNPNTSDIDAALYANKQAVVGRATELTAGTVHAITRSNTDSPVFAFTATSNWTAGDSMSVDGTACTVYLSDGTTPATGAYIINTEVLAIINGTRVTLIGSGASLQSVAAEDVTYDNSVSGLTASDVQNAIDEINSEIINLNAGSVSYNYNISQTWGQIIAALKSAATLVNITKKAAIHMGDGFLNGRVLHMTGSVYDVFSAVSLGASDLRGTMLDLVNEKLYDGVATATTYTRTDISNTNPTADGTITLYY